MLFLNLNLNVAVQFIVGAGSAVLAILLMMIKIPQTAYSMKLTNSKIALVVSLLICSFMMFYTISQYGSEDIWDWEMFTMLNIYLVVHFSTSIISYAMISLLRGEKHKRENLFLPSLFISAIVAFVLMESYEKADMARFSLSCLVAMAVFLVQWVSYVVHFDRAYKQTIKHMENYYDDDESHRIKWVRFCYIISMLTNIFILVYLALFLFMDYKMEVAAIYSLWYLLYFMYITANFISFMSSHKIVLEAVARKVLSGPNIKINIMEGRRVRKIRPEDLSHKDDEFLRIERSLKKWVANKRYCELDMSRDDIAKELKTTKESLHHYFVTKKGVDFNTWRTELRIEEAKRMLIENTDFSINIIGELAGFSDRSNFHRQFVKLVGSSPRQWRESGGKL
jgi:AraC-like DNA-binding protein